MPPRASRPTLRDLAERVGVHVSTVSRALDPATRRSITPEVVERVLAAAKELNYRPNAVAYALRTNRSLTIGVVLPDIANVIFPPIVRGVESVLEPAGYAAILVNTDNSAEREARLIDVLRQRGVDGLIHAAALIEDPALAAAVDDGMSVVAVNRRPRDARVSSVVSDEADGIEQLVAHLCGLGHRRIAHIAGPQVLSTGRSRSEAFGAAMEHRGDAGWRSRMVAADRFTFEEGRRCLAELLARATRAPRPTAIVAGNDLLALGAIRGLADAGLGCPADVSVTGFNDMPFLELMTPALTTVRIEQFDAGRAAARMLLGQLGADNRATAAATARHVTLPVELVVRGSTRAMG